MPWRRMGEWRYSSTIADLSTRWRWVASLTARLLYPWGNRFRYPLDRRLGGPQSRSGRCGEEKILPCLESRKEKLTVPIFSCGFHSYSLHWCTIIHYSHWRYFEIMISVNVHMIEFFFAKLRLLYWLKNKCLSLLFIAAFSGPVLKGGWYWNLSQK
jgi:hypothetical protein